MDSKLLKIDQNSLPVKKVERLERSLTSFVTALSKTNDNPADLSWVKYKMSLDIKSVVKEPAFLKDLSVLHGDRLIQIIALAIERECDDLNFNSNLSPGQVLELSAMIVEGWPYETLEDILMAFKAFKQGKLSINISKLFKFSIPDAMNILNAYLVEVKAPELESHNKTKHIEENESHLKCY